MYSISSIILAFSLTLISGHPQCLDSDPPFKTESDKPVFCEHYKDFGCCTVEKHQELEERFKTITNELKQKRLPLCKEYLRDILCQSCSPYAAHVYEVQPHFPDLCPDYCAKLYDKCRHVVEYLTVDKVIINALSSKKRFCDAVNLEETSIYCWPEIIDNTDLNRAIIRQTDSSLGCLCLKPFASGLYNPMRFLSPADGTGRMFVLEQRGYIWVYSKAGVRHPEPFVNVTGVIRTVEQRGNENGLIGLVFHPDYAHNRKLYLHYTIDERFNWDSISVISEVQASTTKPNQADMSMERVIMQVKQPSSIHNAGELLFGVDGYLYIFLGDGGPANDPLQNGQNLNSLLGSVLRVDVNDPRVPYKVPIDNPFVGLPKVKPEIWAYGVRNPWGADVDEGDPTSGYGKGRIIFGDVGQARWEEVNMLNKGGNYGWRAQEGAHCSNYYGISQPRECDQLKSDKCSLPSKGRVDCGSPGITQQQCEDRNCTWDSRLHSKCYFIGYDKSVIKSCGPTVTSRHYCILNNCCYHDAEKWCFYPNSDPRRQVVDPIGEFDHNYGNAVVPGNVYRGCHNPALNGLYIFGFHFSQNGGRMFMMNETSPNSDRWTTKEVRLCGSDICYNGWTNTYGRYIMGFGEDEDGEVYLLTSDTAILTDGSGQIYRLVDPNRRGDPDSCRSGKWSNRSGPSGPIDQGQVVQ